MYEVPDQEGRRYVVTGANSGTGKEVVRRLARAGAEVVMAVRSPDRGEAARREITDEVPHAKLDVRRLDLADLGSVHTFTREMLDDPGRLDVLVNNAGVMAPPRRMLTTDGFELQLGTNALGPFVLTTLLLPKLLRGDAPRVVTMASAMANYGRIHFDDLQFAGRYSSWAAYAQSKLADLLMARHLAAVAAARGWPLLSTAAHPGYTRTNLQTTGPNLGRGRQRFLFRERFNGIFSQEVPQGAEPLLYAAADPRAVQGGYYGPRHTLTGPVVPARLPRSARGVDLPSSWWSVAERLTGASLPEG